MKNILEKQGFICDMDGVIYHGNKILPGVTEFINWMIDNDKKFVFLTNSSERTPHELSMKLERMGLSVHPDHFYTSAMATAEFLRSQAPGCTAYVIGEAALSKALYDQLDPDGSKFIADRTEVMGYDMTDTSLTKADKKKIRKCFSYEVYANTEQLATQLKCMVDFLEDAARLTGV